MATWGTDTELEEGTEAGLDPATDPPPPQPDPAPSTTEAISRLVASHRHFLDFLSRHVSKPELAEEILQSAFVRTLEKGASIRDPEAIVPWFYRLLRNAAIDHYRRRTTEAKTQTELTELTSPSFELELKDVVCTCVGALLPNLRAEYAEMLQRVDLEDTSVTELATQLGISPNNAMVRLHRARQALRREVERCCGTCAAHGCLDCTCQSGCS
jgi:RNA polymerase sigma-70 factor (ECF subfamily)